MSKADVLICWFQQCGKDSVELVGGKCASLGELINAGIRVPPGFAVTTQTYRRFIAEGGIEAEIDAALDGLDERQTERLDATSAELRTLIEKTNFSIELEDEIGESYRQLSRQCCLPAVPVAIRSSATAEDLPGASFAGQQDTFLWIRGSDQVLDHVRRCFSSLFTARAIAYRLRMNFDHRNVAISVGVQKMANSATAGVMFTLNPSNGDRSTIAINSNFGFGESVVSGEVTPDEFIVNKVSLEPLRRVIGKKEICYAVEPTSHSSKRFEVPIERQRVQSILDEEIIELARLGKLIERHYGCPMDIEWAIDKDMPAGSNIFILQARPETVWSQKQSTTVSTHSKSSVDHILDAMIVGRRI